MVIIIISMDDVSLRHVGDNILFKLVSHLVLGLCGWWPLTSSGLAMDDVSFCHVGNNLLFKLVSHPMLGLCGWWPFNIIGTSLSIGTYLQVLIAMVFCVTLILTWQKWIAHMALVMMATNIFGIPQCFVLLDLLLSSSMKLFCVLLLHFFYICFLCIFFIYNWCIHVPFYKIFFFKAHFKLYQQSWSFVFIQFFINFNQISFEWVVNFFLISCLLSFCFEST